MKEKHLNLEIKIRTITEVHAICVNCGDERVFTMNNPEESDWLGAWRSKHWLCEEEA